MTDQLTETLDALWPNHKLPAPVLAELSRRVGLLPLTTEQIRAALTEYRIEATQYEQVTPNPGKVGRLLRSKAFPASGRESPGSSEREPEAPPEGLMNYGQWRVRASVWVDKQMASPCDCPRFEAIPGYGPNGSDGICRRCGGSFAGKFLKRGGVIGAPHSK